MSEADVRNRIGYLGSSDAKRILDGDWLNLWKEKTGRKKPEDLSHVFRVQLGIHTEHFHAKWLTKWSEFKCEHAPAVNKRKGKDWQRSHLDYWLTDHKTFIELKHSHERMQAWEAAEYYQPQIAHHCLVTNRRYGWLSFIPGNKDPIVVKVQPDEDYMTRLDELEELFWWHVSKDIEPDEITAEAAEVIDKASKASVRVVVNEMRRVDMKGNNEWADAASRYNEHKSSAAKFEAAKKDLKALVPKDAIECFGFEITIKRDARGALRFKGED